MINILLYHFNNYFMYNLFLVTKAAVLKESVLITDLSELLLPYPIARFLIIDNAFYINLDFISPRFKSISSAGIFSTRSE